MAANKKAPVLVILQMSGAYDALNTVIPYNDPLYMDYRPVLKVEPEQVLHIDDNVGFHPAMAPLKASVPVCEMYSRTRLLPSFDEYILANRSSACER